MEKFIVTERWILNADEILAVEQGEGVGTQSRVWMRGLGKPLIVGNEEHCAILKALVEEKDRHIHELEMRAVAS